jgi:hypothetical protein
MRLRVLPVAAFFLVDERFMNKKEPPALLPGVHRSVIGAMCTSQVTLIGLALAADVTPRLSMLVADQAR